MPVIGTNWKANRSHNAGSAWHAYYAGQVQERSKRSCYEQDTALWLGHSQYNLAQEQVPDHLTSSLQCGLKEQECCFPL